MITPSMIYWITRMDAINGGAWGIMVIAAIIAVALFIVGIGLAAERKGCYSESEDYVRQVNEYGRKLLRKSCLMAILFLAMLLVIVFTPTTKQTAAMYVIPAIANNEKLRDTGDKLYEMAVEWINELRPKK